MSEEYVEGIYAGNKLYRMDENRDLEWCKDETYTLTTYPDRLHSAKHELLYELGFRGDSGKIVRYCRLHFSHKSEAAKYLFSPEFKELSADVAMTETMSMLKNKATQLNMETNQMCVETSWKNNMFVLCGNSDFNEMARFAWRMGIDLEKAELVLMVNCFDGGSQTPAVIERDTQKYVEVLYTFGIGHVKWTGEREEAKTDFSHDLSLPDFTTVIEEKTLGEALQITDEENEKMNTVIQEAI